MIALIALAPGKRTFARQNAAMAEKITPTAPEAEVPIWLTKNVSAML